MKTPLHPAIRPETPDDADVIEAVTVAACQRRLELSAFYRSKMSGRYRWMAVLLSSVVAVMLHAHVYLPIVMDMAR